MKAISDPEQAEKVVNTILAIRSENRWFLPGTKQKMIDAALSAANKIDLMDRLQEILWDSEIDDPGGDPCDECWHDRWFYYHPALIL